MLAASGAFGAALAPVQASLPPALVGHVAALAEAAGVSVRGVAQPVPGAEEAFTLVMGKDGRFVLETSSRKVVSDGTVVTVLDKPGKTYAKLPAKEAALEAFARVETWGLAGHVEPQASKLYKSARKAGSRKVAGQQVDEIQATAADGSSGTFYISTETGLAVGYETTRDGKAWLVRFESLELLKEPHEDSVFAFVAPEGAVEKAAASETGWGSVSPVFAKSCMPCHGAQSAGGLDLRSYGPAASSRSVVPGDPAASAMVQYVRGTRTPRMPVGRPPLPEAEIAKIEAWIAAGAKE